MNGVLLVAISLPLCVAGYAIDDDVATNLTKLFSAGGSDLRYFLSNLIFFLSYWVLGGIATRDALRVPMPKIWSRLLFATGIFVLSCGVGHGAKAAAQVMEFQWVVLATHMVGAAISLVAAVVILYARISGDLSLAIGKLRSDD